MVQGGGRGDAGMRPELALEASVGVSCTVRDSVLYLDESEIAHPVGRHVAFTKTDTREMSFVAKVSKMTALCVAPNHTVLAVAEEGASLTEAVVSVYHVPTQRLIRTLRKSGCFGDIVSMAFSHDSRYLVTMAGPPYFDVGYWKWEGEKALVRTRGPALATRARFHPTDSSVVTASGPGLLRLWKLSSSFALKLQPILGAKREAHETFTDHLWMDASTMVALTEHGTVFVLSADAASASFTRALKMTVVQTLKLEPLAPDQAAHGLAAQQAAFVRMEAIERYARGFVVGGSGGMVSVYEETSEGQEDPFMLIKTFRSPAREHVCSLAVSPESERLVCATRCNKLLSFPLGDVDMVIDSEDPFETLPFVQHKGPVTALDVCSGARALLVTTGPDRLLRIVNFETMRCEVQHRFAPGLGDPVCVSVHPGGALLAVGFKEHVRVYDLLVGELREKGAIFLKNCHCVRFAHGGQYLACSTNQSVHLFGAYTAKRVRTFSAHAAKVLQFVFTPDDADIVSIGGDGALLSYNVASGEPRPSLCTNFDASLPSALAVARGGRRAAVACSDGALREVLDGGEVFACAVSAPPAPGPAAPRPYAAELRGNGAGAGAAAAAGAGAAAGAAVEGDGAAEAGAGAGPGVVAGAPGSAGRAASASTFGEDDSEETVTCLLLSADESALVAGTSHGAVRVYQWPLSTHAGAYASFGVHTGAVTQLRASGDGAFVFSSATDGTCFVNRLFHAALAASADEAALHLRMQRQQTSSLAGHHGDLQSGRSRQVPSTSGSEGPGSGSGSGSGLTEAGAASLALVPKDRECWQNDDDSILVSRRQWDAQRAGLEEGRKQMRDAESAQAYALHVKDTEWMESVRSTRSESAKALAKEHKRYEDLQARHEVFVQQKIEEKQRLEAEQIRCARSIENDYETRLGEALRRGDLHAEAVERLRQTTDELLLRQEAAHAAELAAVEAAVAGEVEALGKRTGALARELAQERDKNEEARAQQEAEYELELLNLRGAMAAAVDKERSKLALKQGLLVEQNNRFQRLKSRVAGLKASKAADEAKTKQLEETVEGLQGTLRRYECNLEEREQAFREKEKTILQLRSSQKTLDNFRFVLDSRIEQLMEEKGPIQAHIGKLETHIKAMYHELVSEFDKKKEAERDMGSKQMRVDALGAEVGKLRGRVRDKERELQGLCNAITSCAKMPDAKRAQQAVTEAFRTHVLKEPTHGNRTSLLLEGGGVRAAASGAGSGAGLGVGVGRGLGKGKGMGAGGGAGAGGGSASGSAPGSSTSMLPAVVKGSSAPKTKAGDGGTLGADGLGGADGGGGGGNGNGSSSNSNGESNNGDDVEAAAAQRQTEKLRHVMLADALLGGAGNGAGHRSTVMEAERQRDQMHKTVATLQKAMRSVERKSQDKSKRQVQENVVLIQECNRLRKEAVAYRHKAEQLESRLRKAEKRGFASSSVATSSSTVSLLDDRCET